MHSPDDGALLAIWERAAGRPPTLRNLDLAEAASPGTPRAVLAELSPGRRDDLLLRFRERIFGGGLEGIVTCPACGGELAVACTTDDLRGAASEEPEDTATELSVLVGEHAVRFRVPNSIDLEEAARAASLEEARRLLIGRSVVEARRGAEPATAAELPDDVLAAMEERLAETDPLADVWIEVVCDGCAHRWSAAFDIGSFLWEELGARARRTLRAVHDLATAYGWSEAEILAMGTKRRRAYLAMVTGA